jgi:hypothetical protein
MKLVFLGLALAGVLFSNLPVPVQAGAVKSCCCGETDQPCHSPMVPAPCSACPTPSASALALPLGIVVLSAPTFALVSYKPEEFSARPRAEQPLLTPPRILS